MSCGRRDGWPHLLLWAPDGWPHGGFPFLWAPDGWPHLLLWAPDGWPHGGITLPTQSYLCGRPMAGPSFSCGRLAAGRTEVPMRNCPAGASKLIPLAPTGIYVEVILNVTIVTLARKYSARTSELFPLGAKLVLRTYSTLRRNFSSGV